MRFLTIRREGKIVTAVLYSNRHTAFERADSEFLRQEQREIGGASWVFFVALPKGESAGLFHAIHSFMELASVAEGNRKLLAVVHPANLPSMVAHFGKGWRVTTIEDHRPIGQGFERGNLRLPAGVETHLMVASLQPGQHIHSRGTAPLKEALQVYGGRLEGIFPLDDWPTLSELYVHLDLQRQFCRELTELHDSLRGTDDATERVGYLTRIARLVRAPEPEAGQSLEDVLDSHLPSRGFVERVHATCVARLAELDRVLAERYGSMASSIIRALRDPTADVFDAAFPERVAGKN
jgi:hypothetical protein